MLELIVLFALAALGSFFRDEEAARASAVAVPVSGSGARTGQGQPGGNRVHARTAFEGPQEFGRVASAPHGTQAAPGATEAFMSNLKQKLAASEIAESIPQLKSEATPASAAQPRPTSQADKANDTAQSKPAPTDSEPTDLPASDTLAGDVSDADTIVVVVPQDYDGPCDVTITDAPGRGGQPAAHILVDGQIVAELAGVRAADIPLDSVTVVEEELA
ncbi:hypothetical protein [Rhodalgimonas zhirmunskyi]|uniref:Uncharacterized protein n=1 Tax=Rhodalgimonas zhirmunskyi TaxID=2964767 RepID=A0AAJ1X3I2_9RHOB|nr:hypothetical protein [Rhodoalgimonas zhirmunskyi]MDQ2093323.1 hypothetical protein [Rhodoalgimonas zhirmunskyi]